MNAIEQLYNFLLSMFGCFLFALVFLSVLFLGEGVLYAVRWLYDRWQWVRWFSRM